MRLYNNITFGVMNKQIPIYNIKGTHLINHKLKVQEATKLGLVSSFIMNWGINQE